jgi:hypothetical protein
MLSLRIVIQDFFVFPGIAFRYEVEVAGGQDRSE